MTNPAARPANIRVLLIVVVTVSALSLFAWERARRSSSEPPANDLAQVEKPKPTSLPPAPSPASSRPLGATPAPPPANLNTEALPDDDQTLQDAKLSRSYLSTLKLIIPVAGVTPGQLLDTFTSSRSEGRVHDAIDIPAPAGTTVVAASDGKIIRLFQSERGGTTIYQLSPDKKLVFYYAHLQRYADGLTVGKFVRKGEVVAYVGDTGNAGAGNFHLHFSIAVIKDPKRYREGKNINPYPLLRR